MIALPGNTPAETLAALILDEFFIGMINNKTSACRLIPVQGKKAGDYTEWGGLLNRTPVMPLTSLSNTAFALCGGHIPAPVRNLHN